jgi:hypothetical protein
MLKYAETTGHLSEQVVRSLININASLKPRAAIQEAVWGADYKTAQQDFGKNADAVTRQFNLIGFTFKNLKEYFGGELFQRILPYLKQFNEQLISAIPKIEQMVKQLMVLVPPLMDFLHTSFIVLGAFVQLVSSAVTVLYKLPPAVKYVIEGAMGMYTAFRILSSPLGLVLAGMTALLLLLEDWQGYHSGKVSAIDWGKIDEFAKSFKFLGELAGDIGKVVGVVDHWIESVTGVSNALEILAGAAIAAKLMGFTRMIGGIGSAFTKLIGGARGAAAACAEAAACAGKVGAGIGGGGGAGGVAGALEGGKGKWALEGAGAIAGRLLGGALGFALLGLDAAMTAKQKESEGTLLKGYQPGQQDQLSPLARRLLGLPPVPTPGAAPPAAAVPAAPPAPTAPPAAPVPPVPHPSQITNEPVGSTVTTPWGAGGKWYKPWSWFGGQQQGAAATRGAQVAGPGAPTGAAAQAGTRAAPAGGGWAAEYLTGRFASDTGQGAAGGDIARQQDQYLPALGGGGGGGDGGGGGGGGGGDGGGGGGGGGGDGGEQGKTTLGKLGKGTQARMADVAQRLASDLGLSKEAAAGIVGNLMQESGLRSGAEEKPGTGKGGLGWAQWTGPRRREFEAFLKGHPEMSPDEANYAFLVQDIRKSGNAGMLKQLRKGGMSAAGAAEVFEQGFERAGTPMMARRRGYAEQTMQAMAEHPLISGGTAVAANTNVPGGGVTNGPTINTTINVNGAGDPHAVGNAVASHQQRINESHIRHSQGRVA